MHLNDLPLEAVTATVFVVDQGESMRDSLAKFVEPAGWRIEAVPSASEFLARPRPSAPSCVVVDAHASGVELQHRLAERPETPLIFVTDHGDVRTAVRAMKAGAVDFLIKPLSREPLLEAMRA